MKLGGESVGEAEEEEWGERHMIVHDTLKQKNGNHKKTSTPEIVKRAIKCNFNGTTHLSD